MSPPDLNELMAQARQVQERLAEVQRDLARRRVEGSAGGGMVTAVASGELRVLEVRIEPGLLDLLHDLIDERSVLLHGTARVALYALP